MQAERLTRSGRPRATQRRKAGLKLLATLFLLALIVAALAAYSIYAPIGPPAGTSDDQATYVDIAPGTGTQGIAAQLEQAGVLRSRYAFDLLRGLKGGKLLAGEYRFDHPAPATEVYQRIVRGDVYTHALTIPEGYNIFDIAHAGQRLPRRRAQPDRPHRRPRAQRFLA
jgi:UPF0755 protein